MFTFYELDVLYKLPIVSGGHNKIATFRASSFGPCPTKLLFKRSQWWSNVLKELITVSDTLDSLLLRVYNS